MSRLNTPTPDDLTADARQTLDKLGAQLGFVPNMFKTIASNPNVLEAVQSLQGSMGRVLDARTRHSIALAVSQVNDCDYCLAIHTYSSRKFGGMSSDEISLARTGSSTDPKRAAAAHFAQLVVDSRGQVSDDDLAAVRNAGFSDSEVLAIVAVAVQALFTNFLNNVNRTDIDVPTVDTAGTPG